MSDQQSIQKQYLHWQPESNLKNILLHKNQLLSHPIKLPIYNLTALNFMPLEPPEKQLNDYACYLETQLHKFSAFIVTQNQLNHKHTQLQNTLSTFTKKLLKVQQKLGFLQTYHTNNLTQIKKLSLAKENTRLLQLRIDNVQKQIDTIYEKVSLREVFDINNNLTLRKQNHQEVGISSEEEVHSAHQLPINYVSSEQFNQQIYRIQQELQMKIHRLQVELERNKETNQKLLKSIRDIQAVHLKNTNTLPNMQSYHLRNVSTGSSQQAVTKKELKKMQKKLQTFFTEKFDVISAKSKENISQQNETKKLKKALKFKKNQQKYDKITDESQNIKFKNDKNVFEIKRYSSLNKTPLFTNEILREKDVVNKDRQSQKRGNKPPSTILQSPVNLINSPKNKSIKPTKTKRKSRSKERLKKVNSDYMLVAK